MVFSSQEAKCWRHGKRECYKPRPTLLSEYKSSSLHSYKVKLWWKESLKTNVFFMISDQGPSVIASQSYDQKSYFFDNPRRYDSDEDLTTPQGQTRG